MTETTNTPREITDPFCVGNSHALIVRDLTNTTALCVCGGTIRRLDKSGRQIYAHASGKATCPTYDCACGQRHNIDRATDPEGYAAQQAAVAEAIAAAVQAAGIQF